MMFVMMIGDGKLIMLVIMVMFIRNYGNNGCDNNLHDNDNDQ